MSTTVHMKTLAPPVEVISTTGATSNHTSDNGSATSSTNAGSTGNKQFRRSPKKKVILRADYNGFFPKEFRKSQQLQSIPLSSICRKGTDGQVEFASNWVTDEILPTFWNLLTSFIIEWEIPIDLVFALQDMFENENQRERASALRKYIEFSELDESAPPMTLTDLRESIEEFHNSECETYSLKVNFKGKAVQVFNRSVKDSPDLLEVLASQGYVRSIESGGERTAAASSHVRH